ncbi:MAG TPA: SDR family NAD(P)-dependent oxidoreductase [Nevskiaceae bacterium]|nr:SDR family NAD(P)-dependent oxidoreductase [Nevskiaceae bacterium]
MILPAERAMRVAVTGASGFIGRRLVVELASRGHQVRVLTRRTPQASWWEGVAPQIVRGDLTDTAALERLVADAEVVINLAGLIKATNRQHFMAVNRDGAQTLASVLTPLPAVRLVHISSLAARQPQLSDYAASKRAGEQVVMQGLGPRVLVLRPPAVYGPGDRETLVFFKLAARRWAPLLSADTHARAALIHVADLCSLIRCLVEHEPAPRAQAWEVADDCPQGYSWRQIMQAAARAVGNADLHLFALPHAALRSMATCGDVARLLGNANLLTTQKLRELCFPDWSVPVASRLIPTAWPARFDLDGGFADAVRGYRATGML